MLKQKYFWLVILALVVVAGVYFFGSRIKAAVGGVLSGNNALTKNTPYQGAGVVGTIGAATNEISGGVLERAGSWLGGLAADVRDSFRRF